MLHWLSDTHFKGDPSDRPGPVSPEVAAAALLIEAAHRDSNYTEIERDLATSAIMKMFRKDNAEAVALRREAEAAQASAPYMMRYMTAARDLDPDTKEKFITQLWCVIDSDREETVAESMLVSSVIDVLGISRERARSLRPALPRGEG